MGFRIIYLFIISHLVSLRFAGLPFFIFPQPIPILGNIKGIIDTSGNVMVKYEYDAWGKCKITKDTKVYIFGAETLETLTLSVIVDITSIIAGRIGYKQTWKTESGAYAFEKFSLKAPEIFVGVLIVIYAPQMIPALLPGLAPIFGG